MSEIERNRQVAYSTCDRCDGTGEHYDITCADRVNAGPYAHRCPRCSGRGAVGRVQLTTLEQDARRRAEVEAALPEWGDDEMPTWMQDF